jgi:hypothetical protein
MTVTWTLRGTGRRHANQWPSLATAMPTAEAAWADLTGFHIHDALPTQPPTATHLWAWTRGSWLRVRIDNAHWWAAHLTTEPNDGDPALWLHVEKPDAVDHNEVLHWAPTAGEVAQRRLSPAEALSRPMIELTPLRASTGTFLGSTDTLEHLVAP